MTEERRRRVWRIGIAAIVALLLAGLVINVVQDRRAGAMPDPANCIIGGLAGVGSAGILVAAPPVGVVEVVVQTGVSLAAVAQIADACGAWWTQDLASVVHLYSTPPPGCRPQGPHHCSGGGGGAAVW